MTTIQRVLCAALCGAIFLPGGSVRAQTYKYFQIFDVAHGCYLGAGKSYNGHVYHYQANDLGDHTQWRFVPADSGTYYIVDRRHGAALSSDYRELVILPQVAGHVQDYAGRSCCTWKPEPATTLGAYWFKDLKYGLSIVGGDTYNGNLYIQAPGERRNAQWVMTLAENGSIGPPFFVVGQQLLELALDTNAVSRLEVAPLFSVDQIVNNNTGVEQSTSIEARKTETTSESYSFSKSVSVSIAVSIQSSVSVKGIAELSSTVTTTYQESYTWTSAFEITKTTEYLWTIPVVVPAHSAVRVTAIIRKYVVDFPFNAIVRSTLGDGTVRIDTVAGTWNGVDYLTGAVDYQEVTDVDRSADQLPTSFCLHEAYPNPFNPTTRIEYDLPTRAHVTLAVSNMLGQTVAILVNEIQDAGARRAEFNATGLLSGVYFCRLQAGDFAQTRKIVLLQ